MFGRFPSPFKYVKDRSKIIFADLINNLLIDTLKNKGQLTYR